MGFGISPGLSLDSSEPQEARAVDRQESDLTPFGPSLSVKKAKYFPNKICGMGYRKKSTLGKISVF